MKRARPLGQRSFAVLCELLGNDDELVRAAACAELGLRGREARRAVQKLALAAGYDDERLVRGAATTALASIAVAGDGLDECVVGVLVELEKKTEYPVKAHLAHASELVELALATR